MDRSKDHRRKLLEADRRQVRLITLDLEAAVAEDDQVRAVWAFAERVDLSSFYGEIKSEVGLPGRPAIDPKILFALWVQATLDGVGSAREIERRCSVDLRYQWICGGVVPNYHTLSDFRSRSAKAFDQILTDLVAVMLTEGLVEMKRVAQDGVRVRASAGAGSFRRGKRLKEMRRVAREQVGKLKAELDEDPAGSKRREEAAQKRAANERLERIERALKQLPEAEQRKKSNNGKKKTEARVSTTDPDAHVMKMADGGFRPAFNVQFAADTKSKAIVGVDVTNEGTDLRQMAPMITKIEDSFGCPDQWLVDGGYVNLDVINASAGRGCQIYAPPRAPRAKGQTATEVRRTDSPAVAAWRTRMATEEGKQIYKQRGATAELVNAHARRRGLQQFLVRGLERVLSVVLLHAITHNFARWRALSPAF